MGILKPEVMEFVKIQKFGFAATVCPDGTPNVSPKGTTTVWDDDHLVFADIHSPRTIENLLSNPSIEISMVDVFSRKGYRFKGTGHILSQGPLFERGISFYGDAAAKYSIKNTVLIKIERILPVTSPVNDTGLSEEEVIQKWSDYWNTINVKK